jgi:hypothetical protein
VSGLDDYSKFDISVAMTGDLDERLRTHLQRDPGQEDLTFAFWRPSVGTARYTCIVTELLLPDDDERILRGNVAFTSAYLRRVLAAAPAGHGLVFIHNHGGPGWQGMGSDDVVAERDRLAAAAASTTGLPLLGMTSGTDGSWSARVWLRAARHHYERRWASTVRTVGHRVNITFQPQLLPRPAELGSQQATVSVWGRDAQAALVRAHVGIVGLGSVGSIIAEALARLGIRHVTLIDHDIIEQRNLDRTLGATHADAQLGTAKVDVAERSMLTSHTDPDPHVEAVRDSLLTDTGLRATLDCDVLFSCVDRPWPRAVLNAIAYSHLIPVIDGGILARVDDRGLPLHVDWRIHTLGPGRRCMYCLGALERSDVALDKAG